MIKIGEIKGFYCIYTGNLKALVNKVGILCVGMESKLAPFKWIFKPIEGQDREPYIVNPLNISFLSKEEVERMEIKLSSTKIRANLKKENARNDRIRRHTEIDE